MNKLKTSIFKVLFFFILLIITIILLEISFLLFNKYNQTKVFNCLKDCLIIKKQLINDPVKKKNFILIDRKTYLKKVLENNNDTVVTIPPLRNVLKSNQFYPLAGITNSKTIFCNELGFYASYQSDKFGFNNLNNDYKKPVDYLLIGDSFTHGACVNNEQNLKGNLISLSNQKYNIVNLGYQGTGTLHQYAILKEYFETVRPKNVLFFYFEGNDLSEIWEEMSQPQLKNYLIDKNYSQNLVDNTKITDQILRQYFKKKFIETKLDEIIINKKFINFQLIVSIIKLNQIRSFFRLRKMNNENLENFSILINEIKFYLEKKKSNLVFIYLPDYQRYARNLGDRYKNYKKIINIINNKNIELIDIKKNVFDIHDDPLNLFPYRLTGHYNDDGYKLVSEYIFKNLDN